VLQEAALMGFGISGSDLEPRMVEYTDTNLQWLLRQPGNQNAYHDYQLKVADAARDDFPAMKFIATETYLGRPFSALPNPAVLQEVMRDVDTIHRKFLKNVRQQVKPGLRLCIAVPAWKTPHGFKHLPTLDSLEEIGYTRISFVHTANGALVYHRPEQIVARELVVLTKK
jgi:tRNA G10  N-methylase Trm11